jgi:hypothetical protein
MRIVAHSLRMDGDWAYFGIHVEPIVAGGIAPTAGGIAIARKLNGQWHVAFPTDPDFRLWLEIMPDRLMVPQMRRYFS